MDRVFQALCQTSTSPTGKKMISATTTAHVRPNHGSDRAGAKTSGAGDPSSEVTSASLSWNGGVWGENQLPSGVCQYPDPGLPVGVGPPTGALNGGVCGGNHFPSGACHHPGPLVVPPILLSVCRYPALIDKAQPRPTSVQSTVPKGTRGHPCGWEPRPLGIV